MLETPRLLLREFVDEDADLLWELDSDPEVMRFLGPRLADREAYRERIATVYQPYYASGLGIGVWPAIEKSTGTFIGWFLLRPALDYRFARDAGFTADEWEVGYRLRKASWGQGYATEGAAALLRRAFQFGAKRVVATALVGNIGSTRVMEKIGLRRIGEFAVPGYEMPAVKYALDRSAFPGAP
jgi:RimJ/RimL family protein N-acetyltransferase